MRRLLAASMAISLPLAGCTTGEGATPSAPVTVAQQGGSTPTVAMAPDGRTVYVPWVDTQDSVPNLYLARMGANGQPLGEPVRVNSVPGDASTHDQAPPQVAVGSNGEVYIVWQKSIPVPGRMHPASNLRFAYSTDGGQTFSPTLTVNDDVDGLPASHTFHNVVVGADGTLYVSWLDSRVRDRTRAEWIASGKLKPATPGKHDPAQHKAEEGLPESEIRVASWKPGAERFSASTVVDAGVCPCCRTSLAVGPDGALYVAWRKVFAGNVRDIALVRSTDGGRTFSAPAPVHQDGWVFPGCPHAGPSVTVDREGSVYVAWYTGKEGRQGLHYAVSHDGGAHFGQPTALLRDEWVPPSQVRLTSGKTGVWAAWDDRRGEQKQVQTARLDGSTVRDLSQVGPGESPSITVSGVRGSMVWLDGSTVRLRQLGTASQ